MRGMFNAFTNYVWRGWTLYRAEAEAEAEPEELACRVSICVPSGWILCRCVGRFMLSSACNYNLSLLKFHKTLTPHLGPCCEVQQRHRDEPEIESKWDGLDGGWGMEKEEGWRGSMMVNCTSLFFFFFFFWWRGNGTRQVLRSLGLTRCCLVDQLFGFWVSVSIRFLIHCKSVQEWNEFRAFFHMLLTT